MAGGSWDPTVDKVRAGLYINFQNAAIAQITGGERGIVAIPLKTFAGTAVAKKIYTVDNESTAAALFGAANITSIKLAMQGSNAYGARKAIPGAQKVLVYTMPVYNAATAAQDNIDMRAAFDAYQFDVFVNDGEVISTEQDAQLTWMKNNRDNEGKHYMIVFGGSTADDTDPTVGNARSTRLSDDYSVNLILGGIVSGVAYNSSQYAPWVAGLLAGCPLNRATTYAAAPLDDVSKRLTGPQITTALNGGSFVLVHDGKRVKIERGIATTKGKIRKIRAKIAMANDLKSTADENYIGEIDNNVDGQKALISAVKAYLEVLLNANVITSDFEVKLDPQYASVDDKVYIYVRVVEVDSMEEIYFTVVTG